MADGPGEDTAEPLPDRLAGMEFVLIGNNYMIAFPQAASHFCKIQGTKSNLNRTRMHNAAFHHQRLIDKEGSRRHQESILVRAGNDVHLPGHSNHQIVRRIFHLQHNSVALRRWIGRRLN